MNCFRILVLFLFLLARSQFFKCEKQAVHNINLVFELEEYFPLS